MGDHEVVLRTAVASPTANGHTLSGVRWEIDGDWPEDPRVIETEMSYLLASP